MNFLRIIIILALVGSLSSCVLGDRNLENRSTIVESVDREERTESIGSSSGSSSSLIYHFSIPIGDRKITWSW
ncbi:MAG: hypothetical protein AAF388_00615 [Bacteroidota bacterium]